MADKELKIGTEIIAKVGRNEVEAVIVEINGDNIMARSHKSGKTFRAATILKIKAIPQDDLAPASTTNLSRFRRRFFAILSRFRRQIAGSGTGDRGFSRHHYVFFLFQGLTNILSKCIVQVST